MTTDPSSAFRALSDPTRRKILRMLTERSHRISDITQEFEVSRTAITKHLEILAEANLIYIEPQGREKICTLYLPGFQVVMDWLSFFDQYWDNHLAELRLALKPKQSNPPE